MASVKMIDKVTHSKSFKWSLTFGIICIPAYIITWRFFAFWWFVIAFVDLIIMMGVLVVFLGSVFFWIENRGKASYTFMPFMVNLFTFLLLLFAPSIDRNKAYPKQSFEFDTCKIKKGLPKLYIESYCVFGGGAWGTDRASLYLTDSLNFRFYMGTYDEGNEMIYSKCIKDSLFIEKSKRSEESFKIDTTYVDKKIITTPTIDYKSVVVESKKIAIEDLINGHSFD